MAQRKQIFNIPLAKKLASLGKSATEQMLSEEHDDVGADGVAGKAHDKVERSVQANKAPGKPSLYSRYSAVQSLDKEEPGRENPVKVVNDKLLEIAVENGPGKASSERSGKIVGPVESPYIESSQTITPPNAQDRPMVSPKAPVKPRKQFDKKILKPKKLTYNDQENEKSDEEDGGTMKPPATRTLEDLKKGKKLPNGTSPKKSKQKDDAIVKKAQQKHGAIRKHEPAKSNGQGSKGQGSKNKNLNASADEKRKTRISNNGKGELSTNKENHENLIEENEGAKQKLEKDKSANSNKKQIFYRGHFMKKNPNYSHLVNQEDSTSSAELSRQFTNERGTRLYDLPYSQPQQNFGQKEKLEWLQSRRDIGLWIECCNIGCKKWRYVDSIHDPLDVPKEWNCSMNPDKTMNTCLATERQISPLKRQDLIENQYNAGSIVWARVRGYPWWPGMVDDCPETAQFYWLDEYSIVPTHYHVTFFQEISAQRAWLKPASIKPYVGNENRFLNTAKRATKKEGSLKKALEQARTALTLSITERLREYSFISRYTGPISDPPILDDNEDQEKKSQGKRQKTGKNTQTSKDVFKDEAQTPPLVKKQKLEQIPTSRKPIGQVRDIPQMELDEIFPDMIDNSQPSPVGEKRLPFKKRITKYHGKKLQVRSKGEAENLENIMPSSEASGFELTRDSFIKRSVSDIAHENMDNFSCF